MSIWVIEHLDRIIHPKRLTNVDLGPSHVETTTHGLVSLDEGGPVVEARDLVRTLVVKDNAVECLVVEDFLVLEHLGVFHVFSHTGGVVVPVLLQLEGDHHLVGRVLLWFNHIYYY